MSSVAMEDASSETPCRRLEFKSNKTFLPLFLVSAESALALTTLLSFMGSSQEKKSQEIKLAQYV